MDEDVLVSIRDLHVNFHTFDGVVRALAGVNLELRRGDVLGLVGETGCGKTMTALSIPHLIPCPPGEIAQGEVLFDGKNVLAMSNGELRRLRATRMAMIFQDPTTNLNPVFTIEEQMVDAILSKAEAPATMAMAPFAKWLPSNRQRRREARRIAVEALRRVGIPDPERRIASYPHEFSGGMRQRVLIAMAIAGRPELLIADEPTTALDVSIQAQILRLIQDLVRELDLTVLLITHNLGVVAKVCNKAAVMYAGRVVEQGPVRSIFKEPCHPYTRGLLRAVPRRDKGKGELQGIAGSIPSLINPPVGCRFHPRCPHAMPQCAFEPPPVMRLVGHAHYVACHLYDI
ncbi:MAG: ABC transporter ATP-binding protein [Anaerolineae bacterium]|nr:ABC transporter ATP-binding protein [Anaerolineae bacterium]MDW8099924.1 ABC transporter ATP-binding protein [Anaerolineae bacterium]